MILGKEIYIIDSHSVTIKSRKLTEDGKITGDYHFRTISPVVDIAEETEEIQALVTAARIGYVEPEHETITE